MKLFDIASRLIAFNTVSNQSTVPMANFISEYLEQLGFNIAQHSYSLNGTPKINLIATFGGNNTTLAFSGHMDTVPVGAWSVNSNPFDLTKLGNRYYARGIADMKLFIAFALKAAETVSTIGIKKGFCICLTSDEEVGCLGVKKLIRKTGRPAEYVLIGEPTEMNPIYAHKGYMYIKVEIWGKRGHSSDPKNGQSIVPFLASVLYRLESFQSTLREDTNNVFNPPCPTMNIGVISTDQKLPNGKVVKSSKNIIPGYCVLEIEVRTIPGQNSIDVLRAIELCVKKNVPDGITIEVSPVRSPTPPMLTNKTSEFMANVQQYIGSGDPKTVCYNTEGGAMNESGAQCVICGPGNIKQAHQDNEHVLERYIEDESIIERHITLIHQMC